MSKCFWCEEDKRCPVVIDMERYCNDCFEQLDCARCGEHFEFGENGFGRVGHCHMHHDCARLEAKEMADERRGDELRKRMLMERDA